MANITGRLSGVSWLHGAITAPQGLSAKLSNNVFIRTQVKVVTPTDEVQEIIPDAGYAGLSRVIVEKVPDSYGHIVYNGSTLLVM